MLEPDHSHPWRHFTTLVLLVAIATAFASRWGCSAVGEPPEAKPQLVGASIAAQFRIDQERPYGMSSGTAGVARRDLWNGNKLDLVSTGTGTGPAWTLLAKPDGSAVAMGGSGSPTAWFVPDRIGSYRVRLCVNANANCSILIARVTLDSTGGPTASFGQWMPAPGEQASEANYDGNARGWDERIGGMSGDLDRLVRRVSSVADMVALRNEDGSVTTVELVPDADGGAIGGTFEWDPMSGARHDGDNVVQPGYGTASPVGVGRYVRRSAAVSRYTGAIEGVRAACPPSVARSGFPTCDGVATACPADGPCDAVLITSGPNAGPWVVGAGDWMRRSDYDVSAKAKPGTIVRVTEGTLRGEWYLQTTGGVTLGATQQTWQRNSSEFNVLQFGADPTGATSSADAIDAAFAAANKYADGFSGLGIIATVKFPPGTYATDRTISAMRAPPYYALGIRVEAMGAVLNYSGTSDFIDVEPYPGIGGYTSQTFSMLGGELHAKSLTAGSAIKVMNGTAGISPGNGYAFTNIDQVKCTAEGIAATATRWDYCFFGHEVQSGIIRKLESWSAAIVGIHLDTSSNVATIESPVIVGDGWPDWGWKRGVRTGIEIDNVGDVTIHNPNIGGTFSDAFIDVRYGSSVMVYGGHLEGNLEYTWANPLPPDGTLPTAWGIRVATGVAYSLFYGISGSSYGIGTDDIAPGSTKGVRIVAPYSNGPVVFFKSADMGGVYNGRILSFQDRATQLSSGYMNELISTISAGGYPFVDVTHSNQLNYAYIYDAGLTGDGGYPLDAGGPLVTPFDPGQAPKWEAPLMAEYGPQMAMKFIRPWQCSAQNSIPMTIYAYWNGVTLYWPSNISWQNGPPVFGGSAYYRFRCDYMCQIDKWFCDWQK